MSTGTFIMDTGEASGEWAVPSTVDQDFQTFLALKNGDRKTVGVIELEYGQYRDDINLVGVAGIRINLDKYKELPINQRHLSLEFNRNQPTDPEQNYDKPLSEVVEDQAQTILKLEKERSFLIRSIDELYKGQSDIVDMILSMQQG